MPKMAIARNRLPPIPTAPMASGPRGPTMIVSTMPIVIHPSSARITGTASRLNSERCADMPPNTTVKSGSAGGRRAPAPRRRLAHHLTL